MGWPALPYRDWAETCSALHLWTQIVGKYRLAHTPWLNHSWHATLYVTPRGLTTGMVPDGKSAITLTFDFHDHALIGETADMRESFPLEAMSVADFLSRTTTLVERLGGRMDIHGATAAPRPQLDACPPVYRRAAARRECLRRRLHPESQGLRRSHRSATSHGRHHRYREGPVATSSSGGRCVC